MIYTPRFSASSVKSGYVVPNLDMGTDKLMFGQKVTLVLNGKPTVFLAQDFETEFDPLTGKVIGTYVTLECVSE